MSLENGPFFFLTQLVSWITLLPFFAGLVVCLSHQRGLPKLWPMSLGFAGLVLAGLWNRVGIPIITQTGIASGFLGLFLFLGSLAHLFAMGLLVWGLATLLSDFRRRLSRKDDPLAETI